jgi:hypothetical protein
MLCVRRRQGAVIEEPRWTIMVVIIEHRQRRGAVAMMLGKMPVLERAVLMCGASLMDVERRQRAIDD